MILGSLSLHSRAISIKTNKLIHNLGRGSNNRIIKIMMTMIISMTKMVMMMMMMKAYKTIDKMEINKKRSIDLSFNMQMISLTIINKKRIKIS